MAKRVGRRGSAPDPADAPQDPLVGWGRGHPSPDPTPRVTDGQTFRQPDRILIAIPRLHFMQRGKNAIRASLVVYAEILYGHIA